MAQNTNTDRTSISLTKETCNAIKVIAKKHNIKIYEYVVALVEVAAADETFQKAAIESARHKVIELKRLKTEARRGAAATNKVLLKQLKTMTTEELRALLKLAGKRIPE